MRIPDGLNVNNKELVLKLDKAIYGLKQSGRCWNDKFHYFIRSIGFTQSSSDKCAYVGSYEGDKVYLALYVDDVLLLARKLDTLNGLVEIIKREFNITNNNLRFSVGMEISRKEDGIFISQANYVQRIL